MKRGEVRVGGIASLLLALMGSAQLAACDDDVPPRTRPSDPEAGTKPDKPMTRRVIAAVKLGTAAGTRLKTSIESGKPSTEDYLVMRRMVWAVRPLARLRAQVGAEVILGPPRSVDEGGGALALLDRALAERDGAQAKKQITQCVRALRLIDNELMLNDVPADAAVSALSDVAFDVGLIWSEAYQGVPDSPEAVLADLKGALDAVDMVVAAALEIATPAQRAKAKAPLDEVKREVAVHRKALEGKKHSHQLSRRATFVRRSGALGVAVRKLAAALGVKAKLPYRARYPVADNDPILEPVSALTVPAPRNDPREGDRKAIAALGEALFRDKRLSKGASRACIDCHQPDKAFTDGLKTAPSLDPSHPIVRNTPTLLYGPLHAAQLWDGQFASAERQALKVIHAESEMGLSDEALVQTVTAVADLNAQLSQLFDDGVTAKNIARALVAYEIRDLVPARSPIDRFARGEDGALSAELHRGFDVFVGVGRCGRCHVPPLFGGSRPTDFATPVFAALGVPESPESKKLDPDLGRGKVTKQPIDRHAFKTPTVRNAALTGPYFHNGAYPTLEAVVEFYEKGGAKGVGIDLDNLDPEVREIELTDGQRAALIAFMKTGLLDPGK